MSRARRIAKEIEDAQKDQSDDIQIEIPNPADLSHLKGIFKGPPDTPYEGGRYVVDIQTPNEYPFKPPRMKFDTKVYHPNISSQTGAICLDILKDAWTPILTLKSTLISLQSLLNSPEPNDPQDAEVARHYLTDRKGFNDTARYWAKIYAGAGSSGGSSSSHAAESSNETKKHDGAKREPVPDPIELYGLDRDTVKHFTSMGFSQEKVIEVLRRLNLKKLTGASGQEDQILEELLK